MGFLIQMKTGGFQLDPRTRVIKAAEFGRLAEAGELLEAAAAERETILENAGAEARAIKEQGYRDGVEQAKQQMSEQLINTVLQSVDFLAAVESRIITLVTDTVEKVIGSLDNQELIDRLVRKSLSMAVAEQNVKLRVSRDDAERVKRKLGAILAEFPRVVFIDVVADKTLQDGSCIMESEAGVVDASIVTQLTAIREALRKSFKDHRNR